MCSESIDRKEAVLATQALLLRPGNRTVANHNIPGRRRRIVTGAVRLSGGGHTAHHSDALRVLVVRHSHYRATRRRIAAVRSLAGNQVDPAGAAVGPLRAQAQTAWRDVASIR